VELSHGNQVNELNNVCCTVKLDFSIAKEPGEELNGLSPSLINPQRQLLQVS
jgi:hypothetical protein